MIARCVFALLCAALTRPAMAAEHLLPGRLFYSPAERSMLIDARAHKITELQQSATPPDSGIVSFDGVVTRSDGRATRWVNGDAQTGRRSSAIRNMKPGQIRADKKIYEPYQVLRPAAPATSDAPAVPDEGAQ
jgi:hypothetical protein